MAPVTRSVIPSSTCEGGQMEDLVLFLIYMTGLNVALLISGLIADYVFPHIPFIERYLDSLPDWDED